MSEVNTVCSTCYFFQDNKCYFNIPALISKDYKLENKKGKYVIDGYRCLYAFSKKQFDKHKDNLPEDFENYVRSKNVISYYIILNLTNKTVDEIINIYDNDIKTLNIKPYEISIACTLSKKNILKLINKMKKRNEISWKLHNFINDDDNANDNNIFHTITGTNLDSTKKGFVCYFNDNFKEITEQINYANFIASVKKPLNLTALRDSVGSIHGLCFPIKSFKEIKAYCEKKEEHYMETLKNNTEIIKPYYE